MSKRQSEVNAGAVMTNNYFKVHHYIEIMNLQLDVRTLLFFFDDEDRRSKTRALCAAVACMSTIGALTSGRQVKLSVYRKIEEHAEIEEVGTFAGGAEKPAS